MLYLSKFIFTQFRIIVASDSPLMPRLPFKCLKKSMKSNILIFIPS